MNRLFTAFLYFSFFSLICVTPGYGQNQKSLEDFQQRALQLIDLDANDDVQAIKTHYESGAVREEWVFENQKLNGVSREYYEDGQIKVEGNFKDGKQQGVTKILYPSGQVMAEWNFKKGLREGAAREFHPTGELKIKGTFKKGKQQGLTETYYIGGAFLYNKSAAITPFS